jgi:acyl-coenzyme A synthetase/AMP-(fatty) acid ligase
VDGETLAVGSEVAKAQGLAVINVDDLAHGLPTDDPGLHIGADSLSYIIYTSGSAGQPKDVIRITATCCSRCAGGRSRP